MKKLLCCFIAGLLLLGYAEEADAAKMEQEDLEKVAIALLHPAVVKGLKKHYGGMRQFEQLTLTEIISRPLPPDLKEDSTFKSGGTTFEVKVEMDVLTENGKERAVMLLSNDNALGSFELAGMQIKK